MDKRPPTLLEKTRALDAADVEAFLTRLAVDQKVCVPTHNQALSALVFLYREVQEGHQAYAAAAA